MHNLSRALHYLQNTTPNNDPVYAKVFVNDASGYHAFRNALSRVFALGASRDSLQATCLLEMASKLAVADINVPLADERTAEQKMQKTSLDSMWKCTMLHGRQILGLAKNSLVLPEDIGSSELTKYKPGAGDAAPAKVQDDIFETLNVNKDDKLDNEGECTCMQIVSVLACNWFVNLYVYVQCN